MHERHFNEIAVLGRKRRGCPQENRARPSEVPNRGGDRRIDLEPSCVAYAIT
jgi:hypothetical protein